MVSGAGTARDVGRQVGTKAVVVESSSHSAVHIRSCVRIFFMLVKYWGYAYLELLVRAYPFRLQCYGPITTVKCP